MHLNIDSFHPFIKKEEKIQAKTRGGERGGRI